jgi:protein-disulfide isomerase
VGDQSFVFSSKEVVPSIVSFLLPIFFWVATKKVYTNAIRAEDYRKKVSQFKYNKEIFNSLLAKQKAISSSTEGLGITIGNPSAKNTIIKVCNPYCAPCSKAHPIIDELLEQNEDVKVQILFTAKDDNSIPAKTVKHLMALYAKGDQQQICKALDDWYRADKKNYEVFAIKYLLNGELEKQGEKLQAMSQWCEETDITFTPTFFINGYRLPGIYSIEDLKYLI